MSEEVQRSRWTEEMGTGAACVDFFFQIVNIRKSLPDVIADRNDEGLDDRYDLNSAPRSSVTGPSGAVRRKSRSNWWFRETSTARAGHSTKELGCGPQSRSGVQGELGLMKIERMIIALIMLWTAGAIEKREAAAQAPAPPPVPSVVLPLELTEGATPGAMSRAQPPAGKVTPKGEERRNLPSQQAGVAPRKNPFESGGQPGGLPATASANRVAQLQNPFEWGGHGPRVGLFGLLSAQAQPTPQAPIPTAVPGAPAAPAAPAAGAVAPGAEAIPGEEAAAPGAAPPGAMLPAGAEAFAEAVGEEGPGFAGGLAALGGNVPNMIGDQGPMFLRQNLRFPPVPPPLPPGVPRPGNNPFATAGRSVAAIVPAIRGIKIADNQFPRPVDRIWVDFNYYDGVNQGINNEFRTPIKDMQVYREMFGIEKTFLDQQASIGFRLPLNTLNIMSGFPGVGGTNSSLGNLDSFVKYALYDDGRNFLSVGLDLNYNTGPKSFAGYPNLLGMNPFEIQPFMGYIIQRDRVYLQGFNSIAVPTDRRAATMYYCDIGLGYFVYRSGNPRALISFIVPAFETHLNIPLNWVGFQPQNIGGTPDVVNLTFGLNVGMSNRAILSAAYIRPVTGPLPFTGEFALMLNVPFGQGVRRAAAFTTPPVIGQ
jgi:hypothetical protein